MKTKFKGILTLFLAFIVHASFAQDRTVSGTVSDSTGGLPGVGVLIKGTTQGVETDFDGNYSIKTKTGATLVFSYVGMKTTEKVVGTSSTINVLMEEDANVLEEVVITALGIKREKKSLGFAQQSVKGEQLTQTKEVDVNNAIAGKVAGVQLLGAPSSGFANAVVRLRGESNLLYVVDGVKIENSADINTDDIEDLSVLKGSGATALYGPIGKNGVVIITTKKAKKGKTSFVLDQSLQVSNVYILPEYQNEYGGGYTQTFSTLNGQNIPNYAADESWGPRLDGTLVRHWDSWIPGSSTYGELRPWSANPDNVQDFYESGITTNTSLAFSKGGEGYNIKTVLRNVDIEGVMPNSERNLQQISVGASFDISEQVEVYTNLNYQHRKTLNNPTEGYGNVASNFNQWFQRQVDMNRLRDGYNQNGQFYSWNMRSTTDPNPQYWDSPFFETDLNLKHQTKNATYGNLGLNYKPTDNLTINVEARRAVNAYKSDARVAFGGLNQTSFTQRDDTTTSTEFFGAATYNTDLTEDLDVTATAGTELRQWQRRYIDGATSGGLTIPGIFTVASSKDRPVYTNREWNEKNRAVFATASFGYKDMLYLDGSIRSDWNSNANKENNRVITKGGSLSFLFHKVLDFDALSFGKIRAGFAEAPSFPGVNELQQTYNTGGSFNGTIPFYPTANQANNLLEGGIREELELGAELQFFRNRLGIDFTYFDRKDNNLPIQVPLTGATGYTSSSINSGRLSSNGIEVAISGTPIKNDNLTWNIGLNFATLKRTVDELYIDPTTGEEITTDVLDTSWRGLTLEARVGEEWGAFYGRKIRRDADGNQMLDASGAVQFDQNQYLGNLLPDFTGGLTNSITYKNITLSANIDFQKGGKYFSVTKMFNNYSGLGIETVGNNDLGNPVRDPVANGGGVLVEGVDMTSGAPVSYHVDASSYWPSLFALHERWLYDASYIKLRQLSLGYTLSSKHFENTPIEDITLNAFANNLWLIYSDVKGIDPSEIENSSAGGYRWEEGGQAPSARTFGMNIKIRF
ncbi:MULTISPECIES: SusC/RagA family TonB-linked outer membrane protein [Tenacibaculum]|uniref:SusC/RagA family TonB-linked outer membrane protein n=1 Tax=Tenacibaculum TaxID=104267 RepID=UPI001F0B2818|nr:MULTISPECIES: SusC/RagA family TonB-linked outer membrane protein [Tenacibaculum]MCH3880841.1 SusC/RagA family TonB-linked outer membrane protein [Tenacibaculum aquimarinum]MDO6599560.1 SusC/RagA family TonB-linked outer membrane protein [Tenacibaculum sp. 1_MG-2023]